MVGLIVYIPVKSCSMIEALVGQKSAACQGVVFTSKKRIGRRQPSAKGARSKVLHGQSAVEEASLHPVLVAMRHAALVLVAIAFLSVHSQRLYHTDGAWAALIDGAVTTWGDPERGGVSLGDTGVLDDVVDLVATSSAFVALKSDGSLVSWGRADEGGTVPNRGDGPAPADTEESVVKVVASAHALCALQADGCVIFWGRFGEVSADAVWKNSSQSCGVRDIFASTEAFAVLKYDGAVITWDEEGEHLQHVAVSPDSEGLGEAPSVSNPVIDMVGGFHSFAALKSDGTVITFGHQEYGGDSSSVQKDLRDVLRIEDRGIFHRGFVAWKANSTAVIWGHEKSGVPLSSQVITGVRQVELMLRLHMYII